MQSDSILQLYRESEKTQQISQVLAAADSACVHLKGLKGSSAAFIATALHPLLDKHQLFILRDKEEAAYFMNDLESIIGKDRILFFPASYRRPYEVEDVDNANILLRAETLGKIGKSESKCYIVTYPEALTEKVVTKSLLSKNTIELKKEDTVSLDFINEMLFEYGFERTDYVVEPGQFSIRGGIVDVFSFSNENPYRIEFFGDEIDSIRTFDPVTQYSINQISKIRILPNVQGKILQESRQSFIEYLSNEDGQDTCIWIKDLQFTIEQLDKEFEHAEKAFGKLESTLNHLAPEELFIQHATFTEQCLRFPIIEFGTRFYLKNVKAGIDFDISPQPDFNKNFDLLINDLQSNSENDIGNFIFADGAKQIERIHTIFDDIAVEATHALSPGGPQAPILLNQSIHEGFIDRDLNIACYTDHQIFGRYHRFQLKNSFNKKNEAMTLKELKDLSPGDYVTHIDHGVGRFAGLEKMEVNGKLQEAIRIMYKDNDMLYVSIHSLHRIAKYSGKEGVTPKINKLGSNAWNNLKQKTKKKVKEIAFDLIQLYAKRKAQKGFSFSPDTYLQNELEASFIYEDTPDQVKATIDVKRDMESRSPMDRLVCGDVGFGKTEIAIRAAFKAVADDKQVAVLVPTTILALQHFKTFKERLGEFPCNIDYINRFKSAKAQKEALEKLAKGELDILIGTHAIVGKKVKFKDLGLLIVDEEQKFGVSIKEKLKTLKVNVDTLTLTATPIPRTLQFSLMGARDLSIINTPPPNRYPVQTELHPFNEEIFRDAISYEVSRGGQVFVIHNRVQTINEVAGMIQKICPDVKIGVGHGQMEGHKLEKVMLDFIEGELDVLVATAIVESGLDISNANTIIINQAQMFGLSDLHQLRGRVGRSNKKAFCYLITPELSVLTPEARKRLKAIEEFSDLGSGFNIAMRDLDIRGAGNLLGAEQSGFITEIGFDMYQKILDEAIQELKEEEFKDLFHEEKEIAKEKAPKQVYVKDCQIDTDLEILIPDDYVNNITERLSLYRELDNTSNEEELQAFALHLQDRFGNVPQVTLELIDTIRLRWLAMENGFEKLILKNNRLICYFITKQESPYYQSDVFSQVLRYVQQHPSTCKMKEGNNKLTLSFNDVKSIEEAIGVMNRMSSVVSVG